MASKNGAFIPIYTRWNPETQKVEAGFAPEDYDVMREGYGCSRCFADFRPLWLAECPNCQMPTSEPEIVEPWWLE